MNRSRATREEITEQEANEATARLRTQLTGHLPRLRFVERAVGAGYWELYLSVNEEFSCGLHVQFDYSGSPDELKYVVWSDGEQREIISDTAFKQNVEDVMMHEELNEEQAVSLLMDGQHRYPENHARVMRWPTAQREFLVAHWHVLRMTVNLNATI